MAGAYAELQKYLGSIQETRQACHRDRGRRTA